MNEIKTPPPSVTKAERIAGLNALRAQVTTLKAEVQEKAKASFTDFLPELFAEHPKLVAFGWRQGTPSFNDGDPCYFSAHTDEPKIRFDEEEDLEEFYFDDEEQVGGKWVKKPVSEYDQEKNKAYEAVRELLGVFTEDDYEFMFGDNQAVTVTAAGVETEEDYDY